MWLINIVYIDSRSNMETRCTWRRLHLQGTKNGKEVKPINICIKNDLKEWNWLFDCLQPSKKTVKPAFMLVSETTQTQWEIHTDRRGLNWSRTTNIHQSSERKWPEELKFKGCVTPRPIQSSLRFKRLCTRVAFVKESKCKCSLKH